VCILTQDLWNNNELSVLLERTQYLFVPFATAKLDMCLLSVNIGKSADLSAFVSTGSWRRFAMTLQWWQISSLIMTATQMHQIFLNAGYVPPRKLAIAVKVWCLGCRVKKFMTFA
jgi:hypothetical protein